MATYIGQPKISAKSRIHRLAGNVSDTKSKKGGLRNRGKVTRLRDIPLDIFFKIASSLTPPDLLHLARVSKELRQICLSRQCRHLWIAVTGTYPVYPPARHALSANLVSVDSVLRVNTQACGIGRAGGVEYGIAMRFCWVCHKINLIKDNLHAIARVAYNRWEYLWSNPSSLKNVEKGKYYVPEFKAVVKRYLDIQHEPMEVEKFVSARREYATAMMRLSHELVRWELVVNDEKAKKDNEKRCSRYRSIVRNWKDLGCTTTDFPRTRDWFHQLQKLTPRIWEINRK
ncbi:hypothetical protein SCP_1005200 [Sparassis crispa]|uniref:F-box domain-containing protein n=1 Tax=Sparassis crispa TaxID=139825 RepID=A0A401GYN2_9APHY|nr:hypothetical protein SCP_1005200 [Sparassis crispa]GBE87273.1 hypothetical protein SCP_1005200 [Sparassis crispa]